MFIARISRGRTIRQFVAGVLLVPSLVLTGLQTMIIIAAVPFVLVMVGLAVALVKDLRHDPKVVRRQYASEAVDSAVVSSVTQLGDDFVIAVERDPGAE
jgi:choline-glycine betaine transporter